MTDVSVLAGDLTAFLGPMLPYLFRAGEQAADEAAQAFGKEAWDQAKRLWNALRPGVAAKPAANEAADDLSHHPDDPALQTVFKVQLEKLLRQDPSLQALAASTIENGPASRITINRRRGGVDFHAPAKIGRDVIGGDQINHGPSSTA